MTVSTDYSVYQPPGVTITEDITPVLSPSGVAATVVALVGPGVGYKSSQDQITLNDTTPVQLRRYGIIPASISVTDVAGNVIDPSNYTITVAAGADGNIGNTQDNTTTIVRNGSGIPTGSIVYVNYHYQDAAYFTPSTVSDLPSVVSLYGPPIDPATGNILSPISMAAQLAFLNGASTLVCVATPTPSAGSPVVQADLQAAYAKIASVYAINVVVPLPVGVGDSANLAFAQDLKNHVATCNADGRYRIGIYGSDLSVTASPDTQLAAPLSYDHVIVDSINQVNYYDNVSNSYKTMSGFYHAAAMAGKLSSQAPQVPLTRKTITGFSGLPNTLSTAQKNTLAQGGVTVSEIDRLGRLVIRQGRTTDSSNIMTREVSMVRAKDALVIMLQTGVDSAAMIGTPIDTTTPITIKGLVSGILEAAVASGLIQGYTGLQARQQIYPNGDPTIIEVQFAYQPTFPLNYINVSFTVDLSNGTSSVTTTATNTSGTGTSTSSSR